MKKNIPRAILLGVALILFCIALFKLDMPIMILWGLMSVRFALRAYTLWKSEADFIDRVLPALLGAVACFFIPLLIILRHR